MSCSALATTRQEQKGRTTNQGAASAVTDKLVAKTEQAFTVYTFRNEMLSGISGGPQLFSDRHRQFGSPRVEAVPPGGTNQRGIVAHQY